MKNRVMRVRNTCKLKCQHFFRTFRILRVYFLDRVDSIVTRLDNYNEKGSGAVVLCIENIDVNVCKLKKSFIYRNGHGKRAKVLEYNSYLKGYIGRRQVYFGTGLFQICFSYSSPQTPASGC